RRHKKSGKTQKDKLRSAAKPDATSSSSAWLVAPEKQAKFEQVTPEPALSPLRPAVVQTPSAPAVPLPLAAPVPGVTPNRPPLIPLAPIVVSPPSASAPMPQFASPPPIKPISAPRAA